MRWKYMLPIAWIWSWVWISPAFASEAGEDKAIKIVSQRKEVLAWVKLLKATRGAGQPCFISRDHKGNVYTIQVAESFSDHLATFNWYEVNIANGKVTKQF